MMFTNNNKTNSTVNKNNFEKPLALKLANHLNVPKMKYVGGRLYVCLPCRMFTLPDARGRVASCKRPSYQTKLAQKWSG
jgi:hypothetical protein